MKLPIRARLVIWTSTLILGLLLVLSAFLHYRLRQYLNQEFDTYTRYESRQFAEFLEQGCSEAQFRELVEHEIETHPSNLRIWVMLDSATGESIVRSANLDGAHADFPDAVLDPHQASACDGRLEASPPGRKSHQVRVLTTPVLGTIQERGQGTYFLRILFDLGPLDRLLREHRKNILYAVGIMITLAVGVGWLLAAQAMQPVHNMIRQAERISAPNLSEERLPVRGTGDELDRLAQVLNSLLTRIDQSVRTVRRFTADAAHELRTPLTTIRGELELFHRHPAEFTPAGLEPVLEEIDRLNSLCNRLLLLARLDERTYAVERRPVALDLLIERLVDQVRPLADSRRLRLGFACRAPARVVGNEDLLSQVLLNLLDNAIKHTPAEGSIDVELKTEGDRVVLAVSDTGRGIPAEHLPRIFDRFYRIREESPDDARDGSGLGLAIVKEVVELHHGTVEVDSTVGKGTVFRIRLPGLEAAPAATSA